MCACVSIYTYTYIHTYLHTRTNADDLLYPRLRKLNLKSESLNP